MIEGDHDMNFDHETLLQRGGPPENGSKSPLRLGPNKPYGGGYPTRICLSVTPGWPDQQNSSPVADCRGVELTKHHSFYAGI